LAGGQSLDAGNAVDCSRAKSVAISAWAAVLYITCFAGGIAAQRFALFDTERFEWVDHRAVALQSGLGLHHPIERLEETDIVWNDFVHHRVYRVNKFCLVGISRLREQVEFDPLAVLHRFADILITAALQNRTQQRIALIGK
jgi:hypothetical protein